ncbi:MAG: ABC transporter ATP-binding protein, partial [Acetobacteraceae bacterium]
MSTLSAHDIQVRLGGKPVVAGVEASFQSGTVTAILGPNGAGKSTLLACLAGLRKPNAGQVQLDEAAVLSMHARARARRIGFIPQT